MSSSPVRSATIEDVARHAGVSRAAVSKVLRNAYGVSDDMRERVNAAMSHLDYRPRTAARAMRGRTDTIGIEVPDLGNQFFTRIVAGATSALAGTPYQVVIAPAEQGPQQGLRAIEALVDRQVDGVIAVSPRVEPTVLERIAQHTPIVVLGRHDVGASYDSIAGDDVAGADAVMAHLIERGHRGIAHLTLHDADIDPAAPHAIRLHRYERAMAEIDGPIDVLSTDEGQDAAYESVRRALARLDPPTAIFAAHDELAIGALRAIAEVGAHVAVVGYDDVPIAGHPVMGLTTVHQPGREMGARAVALLLERSGGRSEPVHELFVGELIIRSSTAAEHLRHTS